MSQNFRLFHVSNLSVRNFRIFLLMYTGLLTDLGWGSGNGEGENDRLSRAHAPFDDRENRDVSSIDFEVDDIPRRVCLRSCCRQGRTVRFLEA